ncbi:MAG: AMP-binding protein [Myxococcota bacterium]
MADLSYRRGTPEPALLHETIDTNFRRRVHDQPDRLALVVVHQGVRWSYREFDQRVQDLAKGLLHAGVEKGDRVALWAPNRFEWILVQYATARIGAIMVCINPSYRTRELAYALTQSGTRLLFAAERLKSSDYRAMFEEVAAECPAVERAVFFESPEWNALIASGAAVNDAAVDARRESLAPEDPINIQYTSGTTGLPKGVTLTHRNILNNAYFVGRGCEYTEEDRVCVPVPFYHCFGMVMGNLGATVHGAAIVVPGEAFDPVKVLEAVERERCTSLYGVPTMFIAELGVEGFKNYDLSSLRTGIMAGSPCPIEVMKRVIADMHMTQVTIAYGMTETSPVSTQTRADDPLEKRVATVGRVHPHVEVRIADPETNETVPVGVAGEFQTRGYSVMRGYWNDDAKTTEVIDDDGWMHTGDLATMDDDGYFDIVGRIKDLVIRGGENVSPREVEEFLYRHPEIVDAQVVGVPDAKYGEELCAFVRRATGSVLDAEGVRTFCQGQIAHFKVPRYVLFLEEFPMTVTGKIQKFRLRELAAETLDLTE